MCAWFMNFPAFVDPMSGGTVTAWQSDEYASRRSRPPSILTEQTEFADVALRRAKFYAGKYVVCYLRYCQPRGEGFVCLASGGRISAFEWFAPGDNTTVVRSINVTAPGLSLYAANCTSHSATVIQTAASPQPVPASFAQATALAVGEIHAAVAARASVLGERIAATAGAALGCARLYTDREVANTAKVTVDSIVGATD
jgi:hypothetical protein